IPLGPGLRRDVVLPELRGPGPDELVERGGVGHRANSEGWGRFYSETNHPVYVSRAIMELRIDRLLAQLRDEPAAILPAIDADPLLVKREAGGLVLANAGKQLFPPQAEHQLYAKGIVYRRDPYRLVSLPLLKIYNLGERNVTAHDLTALAGEGARLHFLRK